MVHFVTSIVELFDREHEKSVLTIEKALALDPNYSAAYVLLAQILDSAGRPEAALEPIKKALRLSPNQPFAYIGTLGMAYFSLGRFEEAAKLYNKVLARNPTAQNFRLLLAATYAKLGRIEDAKWEAEELLTLDPEFSLKRISQVMPYKDPAQLETLLESLRKAGLPE